MIREGATLWARQTIESDIFYKKPDKWFKIFFYIVNKVNHQKNAQFDRGQGFVKYEWIMEKTKAKKSEVDHCIRWLKSATMIATQKATRGMIITVLKYNEFQNIRNYKSDTESDNKSELKATQKRHRSDTINNNGNNGNNGNNNITPNGAKYLFNNMPINLEDLNDGDVIYEDLEDKTPKRYKGKSKAYARLAIWWMNLIGEEGNVLRWYPDIKELWEKSVKDVGELEAEKNIMKYILVAREYGKKKGYSPKLGMVVKSWNEIREIQWPEIKDTISIESLLKSTLWKK